MTVMDKQIHATLAFIFSPDLSQVLLIRKNKPPKHAGLLNGLGGKCEAGESHLECVVREVEEECGLKISQQKWLSMGELTWENWQVTLWTTVFDAKLPTQFPEESVDWYPSSPVPEKVLTNLNWLIPLAVDIHLQKAQGTTAPMVSTRYE